MGAEVECVASRGGQSARGKAHLDSVELIFRSPTLKFKLPISAIRNATSYADALRLWTDDGETILELGAKSARWLAKIEHPPTRVEKAGVKPGDRVKLIGVTDDALESEIAAAGATLATRRADIIFLQADAPAQLAKLKMVDAPVVWVVSPRGRPDIADVVVMAAAKKEGWVDVKVMRFNETHTALKFVRRAED